MKTLRIATRASRLALWQSEFVAAALRRAHAGLSVELVPMTTTGDRIIDRPLAAIGGKGLFIKELEIALLEGRADIAVHSVKDLPAALPAEFELGAILARADPRDVLVSDAGSTLDELAPGARVGTSSKRRQAQILARRPDLRMLDLRGNVPTRLAQLEAGRYDAIVLAAAGLGRLGLLDHRAVALKLSEVLPAVGQGAIGIEWRAGDTSVPALFTPLACATTTACVVAERAMNATLGGSCEVPIAGHAEHHGNELSLRGLVASDDGQEIIAEARRGVATAAAALGAELGRALLARGAARILAAAGADRPAQ